MGLAKAPLRNTIALRLGLGAVLCSDEAACTRLWSALAELPTTPRRLQPAERRLLKFLGRRVRPERQR